MSGKTGVVVVGVDGSKSALAAVEWAADDARRRGARLRIVHVREPWANEFPFHGVAGYHQSLTEYCEGVVARAAERAKERAPDLEVTTEVVTGAVIERLLTEAERADVVAVGSRGMGGFAGLVLGSVGMGLASHSPVPVVVVRWLQEKTYDEVVVGVDGEAHTDPALEFAIEEARLRGARLRALHAWHRHLHNPLALAGTPVDRDAFDEEVREFRERLAPWRDRNPDVELIDTAVCGHPVPVLADLSGSADLLVVGSRRHGGIGKALLGSVSHGVLHRARCPSAIVRPKGG
ncbi:MAG: universal stress protein [Thermobispora sp.]|nr:universal stress protein [Thermobispora sp.]